MSSVENKRRSSLGGKGNKGKSNPTLKRQHELNKLDHIYFHNRSNYNDILIKAIDRSKSKESIEKRKSTYASIGHAKGKKNSQFGTIWITNGAENKKIIKTDIVPDGWYKGRTCKK